MFLQETLSTSRIYMLSNPTTPHPRLPTKTCWASGEQSWTEQKINKTGFIQPLSNTGFVNWYESCLIKFWPLLPPKEQTRKKHCEAVTVPLSLAFLLFSLTVKSKHTDMLRRQPFTLSWQTSLFTFDAMKWESICSWFSTSALQRLVSIISPKATDYCRVEVMCLLVYV